MRMLQSRVIISSLA